MSMDFRECWEAIEAIAPSEYGTISLEASILNHGPVLPEQAFENVTDLEEWYENALLHWLRDWREPIGKWQSELVDRDRELALLTIAIEARNAGVRRLIRRIFHQFDGTYRAAPIHDVAELLQWCDFMLRLLNDDDEHVDPTRSHLTLRYDLGVAHRNAKERARLEQELDPWVASMTSAFMEAVSKGKPHDVPPDDEWILVVWAGLLDDKCVDEVATSLFVDSNEVAKAPNEDLIKKVTESTWKAMRRLDVVVAPEPTPTSYAGVRNAIDGVRLALGEMNLSGPPTSQVGRCFDVFLSHNSKEKPIVRRLAKKLKERGLTVWIDEEQLRPGKPWQESLEEIIETCKSAAILVGQNGLGPWQDREIRSCLTQFVKRGLPAIPVLLPECETPPDLPLFLREFAWVDLREGIRKNGVDELVWGITGSPPGSQQ